MKSAILFVAALALASSAFAQEKPKTIPEIRAAVSQEAREIQTQWNAPEANSTKDAAFAGASTASVIWITGAASTFAWSVPVVGIVVLTAMVATKKLGAYVRGEP